MNSRKEQLQICVDLQQLETYADRLFAAGGIDVEFSKHFKDRVNDPKKRKALIMLSMAELTRLCQTNI